MMTTACEAEPKTQMVDVAEIPGGGLLHLLRRGDDFEIIFGDEQLMANWSHQSEEALATLVAERLPIPGRRILIGGLGMGFTLAAARSAFAGDSRIVVAELVPKVVAWATGELAHLFGTSLSDPRVSIEVKDVHDVIVEQPGGFDAILLDVDNGPDGLISLANERLYCNWGLHAAYAALRPGGILAIWSAYTDGAFADRLARAGFAVDEIMIASDDGARHGHDVIWLASRPNDGSAGAGR